MTVTEIRGRLDRIQRCGGAVWDCKEDKVLIRVLNHFRPEIHGNYQYKPQCLKCGRIGTAKATSNGQHTIELEKAKDFESRKRSERESLYKAYSEAHEQERENKQEQWQRSYEAYLLTPQWADRRAKVLLRDKMICQGCRVKEAVQVHHLSYRHLGDEPLFELVSVCLSCHEKLHNDRQPK